jgi:beta-galactosidase
MNKSGFAKYFHRTMLLLATYIAVLAFTGYSGNSTVVGTARQATSPRTRSPINNDWRFTKRDPPNNQTSLPYGTVKSWILPAGNDFLMDPTKRAKRPEGNPGADVAYITASYDDTSWQK